MLGSSRFAIVSVALHATVAAFVLTHHPQDERRPNRTLVVAINRLPPRPPPVIPPEPVPPVPVRPPVPTQPWRAHPPAHPPLRPPQPVAPPPPAVNPAPVNPPPPVTNPNPPPPSVGHPPGRPNLFNPIALNTAAGTLAVPPASVRDPGGRTVRDRDPNAPRTDAESKEIAAHNIREMLGEDKMTRDLASGKVAPRWREAERQILADFHPPPGEVSDDGFLKGLGKAFAQFRPVGGDTPRGVDPSASNNPYGGGLNGNMANPSGSSQDPNSNDVRRCIVEVVVDKDGGILSARVLTRSGKRKFDAEALRAVMLAVGKGGKLDEGTAVVTKWSVEAWVTVSASITPGFSFDESSGKVGANYPGKKSTPTKVRLLSVLPREKL